MNSIAELRGPLLRAVSRSFYLSIRLLPPGVRDPIALAYLLARATDTIADTVEVAAPVRLEQIGTLSRLIQGEIDRSAIDLLVRSFAPRQKIESEKRLMEELPAILEWLESANEDDRATIRTVLRTITEGQTFDVQRFGDGSAVTALETAAELNRYTYLVAGCVGEFWTTICFRHLRNFSNIAPPQMHVLGKAYGQGLQLINILRDLRSDLAAGRCYLPADELHSLGIAVEELRSRTAETEPLLHKWHEQARSGLAAGIDYACAIQPWRVRLATALPALIGARTLALLQDAGAEAFDRRVKISRAEVRTILFKTILHLASPKSLREQFRQLSLGTQR